VFWHYSWADSIYGVTNNAAQDALSWSMTGVLPDFTSPNVTLQVNGITYYYVMSKDPAEDVKVYVRNEDAVNGGYIFEEVDDWSGLPGNSIQKNFRFAGIPGEQWGQGSMDVEGNGTISDPSMIYSYRMDITPDQVVCVNPLSDPTCPGFLNAVYKYVSGIQVMTPDEEFYEYWLEFKESQKVELEEDDEAEILLEEDEEDLELLLRSDPTVGGLIDIKRQEQTLKRLANVPLLHPYYEVEYQGKDYPDKNIIEDKKMPDNNRALRQLAGSAKYYSMVRSQYDREELTGE
jgi:hypothetical protein